MSSENHGAIADRYSAALFELAEQEGNIDAVASDLEAFQGMLKASKDLQRLIGNPSFGRGDVHKAIIAIAEKAGFTPLTTRYLGVLADHRRLSSAAAIAAAFFERLAHKKGQVVAELTTAIALKEDQVNEIIDLVKKNVGGEVSLTQKVDPSLLGGLVLRVGSRLIDNSLKTKLQHLKLAMKGIG